MAFLEEGFSFEELFFEFYGNWSKETLNFWYCKKIRGSRFALWTRVTFKLAIENLWPVNKRPTVELSGAKV